MLRTALSALMLLVASASGAAAQATGKGTIGGLPYVTLTSPDGCSTAAPCTILEYLHPLGEQDKAPAQIQRYFNNSAFWSANPHTIVAAPMIPGSSSTNNWGNVQAGINKNMTAAVDLVGQIKATVPTNGKTTLAGGSMGAIGGELLMALYGPKGSQQAGVYQAGLFYDGAPYTISTAAMKANLCGIPLTIVHSAADHTVSPVPDQNMAKTLSGCAGFQFISIPNLGHGSYSGSSIGLGNPQLITQAMTAAKASGPVLTMAGMTAAAPTFMPTVTPVTAAPAPSAGPPPGEPAVTIAAHMPLPGLQGATLRPGGGSVTVDGHQWEIGADTLVYEDGRVVYASRGTSDMAFVQNADGSFTVWGKDDGNGPAPGAWFTLPSNPSAQQRWTVSQTPPPGFVDTTDQTNQAIQTASDAITQAARQAIDQQSPPPPPTTAALYNCTGTTPNADPTQGGFETWGDGTIKAPDGSTFIARGSNIRSTEQGDVDAMLAALPGINFVRMQVRNHDSPASLKATIDKLTAKGIVVLLEDHPNAGGGQGSIAALQGPDVAWLAQVAGAFKNNPYVWYATYNEPPTNGNLTAWHMASYAAIRGAGATAPILIEPGGSRPWQLTNPLNLAAYKAMENIVADPHVYPYQANYSAALSDQVTNVKGMVAAAQKIVSTSGPVPVIIAEFGDSTIGMKRDSGGMETVQAVLDSGVGYAAETWIGAGANRLQTGGKLTDFGQAVAKSIAQGAGAQPGGCAIAPVPTVQLLPQQALPAITGVSTGPGLVPQNSLANIKAPPGMGIQ